MPRQAIQDSVDFFVLTTAELTSDVDDLRIADGTRAWVRGVVQHGLWCLDQTSVLPLSPTAVATMSGIGRWISFGAGGGVMFPGSPNAIKFENPAGTNLTDDPDLVAAPLDAFSRPQVWDHRLGPTLRGAILRQGAWSADGDAFDVKSEGVVSYGSNTVNGGPSPVAGGYFFHTPHSFGQYCIIPGVNAGSLIPICAWEDGSLDAPGIGGPLAGPNPNKLVMYDDAAILKFSVDRTTGDVYVAGKLTVVGVIDPTALILSDPAAGTNLYVESADGATAAVSPASKGRLRYNTPTQSWQESHNGSPYADLIGGGTISVANEAALTAYLAAGLKDGTRAYVATHRSFWTLRMQALTLRDNEIIAASVAGFQWVRETNDQHMSWAFTYSTATPVFIDPSLAASANENDGLTAATALQNADELWRRCPVLVQDLTIRYVGASALATPLACAPQTRYLSVFSATARITVTIEGVVTLGILPAGATGVFASSTAGTPGSGGVTGNVPPQITDTGGAGVVWTRGTLIEVLTGASAGARSFVMFDEGGGLASVDCWRNAAGTANVTPPVAGDTYRVVTVTGAPNLYLVGDASYIVRNFRFTAWTQMDGNGPSNAVATLQHCSLVFPVFAPLESAVVLQSCYVAVTVFLIANGVLCNCSGTSFDRVGITQPMRCTYGGRLSLAQGFVQSSAAGFGIAVAAPFSADGIAGGQIGALSNFGVRGVGASAAVQVRKGGKLNVTGAFWGAGNATIGTQVVEGGQVYVLSTVTPTITAAVTELVIGTLAAPATWIAWVAAGRNAADASVNAAVLDAA